MRPCAERVTRLILAAWVVFSGTACSDRGSTPLPPEEIIAVWPDGPPEGWSLSEERVERYRGGIERVSNVSRPTLAYSAPSVADEDLNRHAMIVCPGGGYSFLATGHEGREVTSWLNSIGVHAFLLEYRLPRKGIDETRHGPALQDAQRSISIVRSRAREWGIDPGAIGILGFSAGGHLAAVTSTRFQARSYEPRDDHDRTSCRPDYTCLVYPAYIVRDGAPDRMAGEIRIDERTPPAFLVHTSDDSFTAEGPARYYFTLRDMGVEAELHVFARGGHGYGLGGEDLPISAWPGLLETWIRRR